MLALSTAWNAKRQSNPQALLEEIKSLGFDYIELGYSFSELFLEEMLAVLPKIGLKVSSVHNYCPSPDDGQPDRHVSNLHRMSAINEMERKRAVFWTKKSIDTAARVGAKIVVIHAGTVEIEGDLEKQLIQMHKEGQGTSAEFSRLRDNFIKERRKSAGPHLEAISRSLAEILPYARTKNVLIGLETRYYPTEIPNQEEVGYFLTQFAASGLVYWHDNGHAEVNERLGLATHLGYLEPYYQYLYGMHIHGVLGLRDHQAPFTGDFDFARIEKFLLKPGLIKVIESHQNATPELIKAAMAKLA